jgi:hypothetical protein
VEAIDVQCVVFPFAAVTQTTMTFRNDQAHADCEGLLEFPLDEGEVVCGYALDVDGVMVDAVMVEQAAAKRAYDREMFEQRVVQTRRDRTTTAQREQVAVLERVAGNALRLRVFPVPAHGRRMVRVVVMGDALLVHVARLACATEIEDAQLSIRVVAPAGCQPILQGRLPSEARLERRASGEYFLAVSTTRPESAVDWEARISIAQGMQRCVHTIERVVSGDTYFCISDQPDMACFPQNLSESSRHPRTFGVFWDGSFSAKSSNVSEKLAIIEQLMAATGSQVDLFIFRSNGTPRRLLRCSTVTQLGKAINKVVYDGATDLKLLTFPTECKDLPGQ